MNISKWLHKKYPQNIIIKHPLAGTLLFFVLSVCFVIIYRPFQLHESRLFNYEMTMAIYFLIVAVPLFGIVKLLKRIDYFSIPEEWTIIKEISSIVISLSGVGITIYLAGFLLENPERRWNLSTFLNSVIIAFLIGVVPFLFFSVLNYRYLFVNDIIKSYETDKNKPEPEKAEELIRITSQLKKEELVFYPSQLIYAESDGNYIIFHLAAENLVKKRIIRNSITNIEQQLSGISFLFRTHRAFIVNIKKVSSQNGNTLGYRLKLPGIEQEIPVSRQKTRDFEQIMKQFH